MALAALLTVMPGGSGLRAQGTFSDGTEMPLAELDGPTPEDLWGQACARCHADPMALVRGSSSLIGRDDKTQARWLAVYLVRHHAPDPEVAAALAKWLAAL